MKPEMIVAEPNGIGFALGGLAGNNAHGAGFLQAALDTGVTPEMISCTSGQLLWVWYYLRLLDNDTAVSGDGTLERRFQDELDKFSPLALIVDAVPTPWPPAEEVVRRAADLSRDWPFARDFSWWWLTLFGKKDRYQPCFQSLWLDILRNAQQSTNNLVQKLMNGELGDAFLVEFLANIAPNRVLKPDFSQQFFDNISATFNSSEIGIVFNSYQPGSCAGTPGPREYIHINDVARKQLGREYGTPASYRAHTTYAKITPDAVRSALWLYMYGFDEADTRLDGAYYRQMILSEVCTPTIDRIFAVRPLSAEWKGPLPTTFPAGKDLETEVAFNGSYIGERDKIDLMNKVGGDMRAILEQLTKTGVDVPDQLRDTLDKYHQIDVIDVEIETQRGYFDYVFEDMDTFRRGRALGRKRLSEATVAISRARQLDAELDEHLT
jgi:hypothetical protein